MARDFPGNVANRFDIGDVASVDITGTALSIACWFFMDTALSFAVIVNKGGSGAATQYTMGVNSSSIFASIGDGAGEDLFSAGTVSTGVWTHLCFVKAGTGANAHRMYINGSRTNNTSSRSIQNSATGLRIGCSTGGTLPIDGKLGELGIWSDSLTDDEVTSLVRGFSPRLIRPQSLALFMPMLEDSGNGIDLRHGVTATLSGTLAAADHPRIIMPSEAIYTP